MFSIINLQQGRPMSQCYKWIGMLFLLLLTFVNGVHAHIREWEEWEDIIRYRVTRSDYILSTEFNMSNERYSLGKVVKSVFHITTHYQAYDRFGMYEGQGICRFFCLGSFYTWGTEIDVYDVNGEKVGMIDGQALSSEPAKFSFYGAMGQRVAIGYLDQNCMGFTLVDPENSAFVLASLTRNFKADTPDDWDVVIYDPERMPARLVKIFAAFVCDTQNKFKPDL